MIKLEVETTIYPSEDEQKIRKALRFLYPFEDFLVTPTKEPETFKISASATGLIALDGLFSIVRKQRNVQTFRVVMFDIMELELNRVRFMIHKQFLTKGRVNLCETEDESPLGPVIVDITGKNIEQIINYLFPRTENGEVLESQDVPME